MKATLDALKSPPAHYIFISSCSAYDNSKYPHELKSESTPLLPCTEAQAVDRSTASYGEHKAECERLLMASGLPYVILRPALVYGQYDHTDRFYYWLHATKRHENVLLPNHGNDKFSATYVYDLVSAIHVLIEQQAPNCAYNMVSYPQLSIAHIVSTAAKILNHKIECINAPAAFLKANNISQWTDMPLWIDGDHFTYSNDMIVNDIKSTCTSFTERVEKTINYYEGLN